MRRLLERLVQLPLWKVLVLVFLSFYIDFALGVIVSW